MGRQGPLRDCEDDEQDQNGYEEGNEAQLPTQPHLLQHVVHLLLRGCQPVMCAFHLLIQIIQHPVWRSACFREW